MHKLISECMKKIFLYIQHKMRFFCMSINKTSPEA
jgi:hypothetical protein